MTFITTAIGTSDSGNSSSSTLGGGATFTGTWLSVQEYEACIVSVTTDQSSAASGLVIQHSSDASTVHQSESYTVTSPGTVVTVKHKNRYLRVTYTNGATPQGSFNLEVVNKVASSVAGLTDAELRASAVSTSEDFSSAGTIDAANSTTSTLGGGGTFTGSSFTDVTRYATSSVVINTDQASASNGLVIQFSIDGVTVDRTRTYDVPSGSTAHQVTNVSQYLRIVYTNGATPQGTFRLQTMHHVSRSLPVTSTITETITGDTDVQVVRAVVAASDATGQYRNLQVDQRNLLRTTIENPLTPFGAVHTEPYYPQIQEDAVYGLHDSQVIATTGLAFDPGPAIGANSASVTTTDNKYVCSTGTTAFSFSSLQSRERCKYRPGQGIVGRFTALFSAPVASSILVAGVGSGESGFYFGYNGTSFGILHSTGGVREIQTFTVSAATATGGTATFRLNGLDSTVTLSTAATTAATAYNISQQTFPGWSVSARGSDVIFLAAGVGNKTGTFSFTLGTAVGTAGSFAETLAGVAATDTWVPQSSWNLDVLDGTGGSGVTLDPTKGNIFQFSVQYLGFGGVTASVEIDTPGASLIAPVHEFRFPNTLTAPHQSQPTFPFTMSAYSSGSTTDVSVSVGSFAVFTEGARVLNGPRMSYSREANSFVGSAASTYYPLFTVRNDFVFSGRANQTTISIVSIGAAHGDNTPATMYLIRDAVLAGPVNFTQWSVDSPSYIDTGATTCTLPSNDSVIVSLPMGNGGESVFNFRDLININPGESVTVAGRAVTGTAVWFVGNMNTREDH